MEKEKEKEKEEEFSRDQEYMQRWMQLQVAKQLQSESVPVKVFQVLLYPGQFKQSRMGYMNENNKSLSLEILSNMPSVASPQTQRLELAARSKEYIRVSLKAPLVNCQLQAQLAIIDCFTDRVREVLQFEVVVKGDHPVEPKPCR